MDRWVKAALALLVAAGLAGGLGSVATGKPKPPKPPKPKLELLTTTERGALDKRAIKVRVSSKRGKDVRVRAQLVVDGFPSDFFFRLGPESKRLKGGEAKVRFKLSARKLEVLAFAEQACDGATIAIEAKTAGRTGKLNTRLKRSPECGAG